MGSTPKITVKGDAQIVKVGQSASNARGQTPFAKDTKTAAPKPLSAK